jgi:hypothetical protein
MSGHSSEVTHIAACVRRYVALHPGAADSAVGIAAWWLCEPRKVSPAVEEALTELVRIRVLQREQLADGTVMYSATRRLPQDD